MSLNIAAPPTGATEECRLCGGVAVFAFRKVLLGRHDVAYFKCGECRGLQTEQPYWLGEAYSAENASLDPGAVQRCIDNLALTLTVSRVLACQKIVDYGGGHGLLCRLLRDAGRDCYSFDRYRAHGYAAGFEIASMPAGTDMVTAFEVIEHFDEPAKQLDEIFAGAPRFILATTALYEEQGPEWWYLAPEEGQHVFMYARRSLEAVAHRFNYRLVSGGGWALFCRDTLSLARMRMLAFATHPRLLKAVRIFAMMRSGTGAERDYRMLCAARTSATVTTSRSKTESGGT